MTIKEELHLVKIGRRKFYYKRNGHTTVGNPKYIVYYESKIGDLCGVSVVNNTYGSIREYIQKILLPKIKELY